MAYADVTQAQAYMAAVGVGLSDLPSSTQLESLIDDCATEIDAALSSRGYETPVTFPPEAVALAGVINAKGAVAYVLSQVIPAFIESGRGDPTGYCTRLFEEYQVGLVNLEGAMVPVGMPRRELQASPMSNLTAQGAWGTVEAHDVFGDPIKAKPAFRRNHDL